MVASLCNFVFPRRKDATRKDAIRKDEKSAMRKDEKTNRQNRPWEKTKFQSGKTKKPCENTPFKTFLSTFRVASFRMASFLFSPGVISSFCLFAWRFYSPVYHSYNIPFFSINKKMVSIFLHKLCSKRWG